jgi:hypothetical protein
MKLPPVFENSHLTALTLHAVPEDRTRFEHMVELAGRPLSVVAQAQEAKQ